MPRGPKGERRPGDVIGNPDKFIRIPGGDVPEDYHQATKAEGKNPAAVALGRMGGKARAQALGKRKRTEIARRAAAARWNAK